MSHQDHPYPPHSCVDCLRDELRALAARVAELEAAAPRCSREGCRRLADPRTPRVFVFTITPLLCTAHYEEDQRAMKSAAERIRGPSDA